jgi:hypothetical protein
MRRAVCNSFKTMADMFPRTVGIALPPERITTKLPRQEPGHKLVENYRGFSQTRKMAHQSAPHGKLRIGKANF